MEKHWKNVEQLLRSYGTLLHFEVAHSESVFGHQWIWISGSLMLLLMMLTYSIITLYSLYLIILMSLHFTSQTGPWKLGNCPWCPHLDIWRLPKRAIQWQKPHRCRLQHFDKDDKVSSLQPHSAGILKHSQLMPTSIFLGPKTHQPAPTFLIFTP